MSQVYFNGQKFFELSRAGQLDARLKEKKDAKLGKFNIINLYLKTYIITIILHILIQQNLKLFI